MKEIINKMVSAGEFIVINNSYQQYLYQKLTLNLSVQLTLNLASGYNFLGFDLAKKPNILVVNVTEEDTTSFFETISRQIEYKNVENYNNIEVLSISPNELIGASDIDELSNFIDKSNYDIIFWNNVNNLYEFFVSHFKKIESFEDPLDHAIFVIKTVSGMKTKLISHLYSHILDKESFKKINDIASSTITLTHKNIIEGYQVEFDNNYKDSKSVVKLAYDDEREFFLIKHISTYEKNTKISEKDFSPPLDPLSKMEE